MKDKVGYVCILVIYLAVGWVQTWPDSLSTGEGYRDEQSGGLASPLGVTPDVGARVASTHLPESGVREAPWKREAGLSNLRGEAQVQWEARQRTRTDRAWLGNSVADTTQDMAWTGEKGFWVLGWFEQPRRSRAGRCGRLGTTPSNESTQGVRRDA